MNTLQNNMQIGLRSRKFALLLLLVLVLVGEDLGGS